MAVKKYSSILDYPKPGLDTGVWDREGKLLPEHKKLILEQIDRLWVCGKLKSKEWMSDIKIIGSLTTYQYISTSDLDIHIVVPDIKKVIELEGSDLNPQAMHDCLEDLREKCEPWPMLSGTKHPIEFYFETEFVNREGSPGSGQYSILTDKWLVPPVVISHDFDIEEIKPFLIDFANTIAEDMDVSFGEIKRQIHRIEELQETLQAWPPEQRQLFRTKIEEKLQLIEEEINDLSSIREDIVEKRRNYDPQSSQEITFKYLQKFGYIWMIKQLEDILEQTKEVTESVVPEIKEVVEEGAQGKTAILKEAIEKFRINSVPVYVNPSKVETLNLKRKAKYQSLRALIDKKTKTLYVWDGFYLHHGDVSDHVGRSEHIDFILNLDSNVNTLYEVFEEIRKTALLKESEEWMEIGTFNLSLNSGDTKEISILVPSTELYQYYDLMRWFYEAHPDWPTKTDKDSKKFFQDIDRKRSQIHDRLTNKSWNKMVKDNPDYNPALLSKDHWRHLIYQIVEEWALLAKDIPKETSLKTTQEKSNLGCGSLCIDFDNTIAKENDDRSIGEPMEGVKEALDSLKQEGWEIVIYSYRANFSNGEDDIKSFLDKHNIPYDSIFVGKPLAQWYIDDHAMQFTSWPEVLKNVKQHEVHDKLVCEDDHEEMSWVGETEKWSCPKCHKEKILTKSSLNITKTAKEEIPVYSSILFNIPKEVSEQLIAWGKEHILDEALFIDESLPSSGRELESHVTLKYGLLTNNGDEVKDALKDQKPPKIKFGMVKHFEPKDRPFDVVVVEVLSHDLVNLNKYICSQVKCAEEEFGYHPHATIAYVKRGRGKEFIGDKFFKDTELVLNDLVFSPVEGKSTEFSLDAKKEADFSPSMAVSAPENPWQSDSNLEIPVDPDPVSDETTYYNPLVNKPRKHFWDRIIDMLSTPIDKEETEKEADRDPKDKFYKPKTTWGPYPGHDGEPFSPLPVTYSPETNPENENWRFPYRFVRRPVGPYFSNEGEVNNVLFHQMPLSKREMKATMLFAYDNESIDLSELSKRTWEQLPEKIQKQMLEIGSGQAKDFHVSFDIVKQTPVWRAIVRNQVLPDQFNIWVEKVIKQHNVSPTIPLTAGNESSCYTDQEMEEIYDEQHEMHDNPGDNMFRDFNDNTTDYPKPEDWEHQKVFLDQLEKPVDRKWAPGTPSSDPAFYEGMPAAEYNGDYSETEEQ